MSSVVRVVVVSLVLSFLAGCVTTRRAAWQPPRLVGNQLTLVDANGVYSNLVFEANWQFDGSRYCATDEIRLLTPGGPISFYESNVCATAQPFSMVGEGRVPFPALGYLADLGISVEAPRSRIVLGLGSQLGSIDIAGEPMKLAKDRYYLTVEYSGKYDVAIGSASLSTPGGGSRLVLDPFEPLVYVEGDLAGMLTGGVMDDAALGFAASGRLPFKTKHALFDGRTLARRELTGHLMLAGKVPMAGYPISVAGRFVADVDADDDGITVFAGDVRDVVLAGDAVVSLGYDKAGFDMSVEVGTASAMYDAREGIAGGFYFGGSTPAKTFQGTALEVIEPARSTIELYGFFRGFDDFAYKYTTDSRMLGFDVSSTSVELGPRRVAIAGKLDIPAVGSAAVSGEIRGNGKFSLTGRGALRPAGIALADASVTLSQSGARLAGKVQFAGSSFRVSGKVTTRGRFDLAGKLDINLLLVRGDVSLAVSPTGIRAAFSGRACISKNSCVPLVGFEVDTRGRICPTYPVIGKQCIKILGPKKKKKKKKRRKRKKLFR